MKAATLARMRINWRGQTPEFPEISADLSAMTPLVVSDYVSHLESVVASMSDYVDVPAGVLEALPKVWAAGCTTTEQDGFWHLFAPGGEGIVSAASFRELCAAIPSVPSSDLLDAITEADRAMMRVVDLLMKSGDQRWRGKATLQSQFICDIQNEECEKAASNAERQRPDGAGRTP